MGCGASSPEQLPHAVHPRYEATGGGSVILARGSRSAGPRGDSDGGGDDDELAPTKGGSYVIGRKYAGAWEPGSPIDRPENNTRAAHYYMPPDDGGAVLRVSYSAFSIQGRSPQPHQKPNQDSHLLLPRLGNRADCALFGVFDGHGPKGEDAAHYCRVNLPDVALSRPAFAVSPLEAVAGSFEALHRQFIAPTAGPRRLGVDTSVSGSTACVLALVGREWLVANVGDSRAIMVTAEPAPGWAGGGGSDDGDAAGVGVGAATASVISSGQQQHPPGGDISGGGDVTSASLSHGFGGSRDSSGAVMATAAARAAAVTGGPGAAAAVVAAAASQPPPPSLSNAAGGSRLPGTAGSRQSISSQRPHSVASTRPLSSDHKPSRPDEHARVARQPAAHIASEAELGIAGGGDAKLYICRVHNGSIRYGVLFSRSIGDADAHAHLGLVATPEVMRGRVGPHDVAVVLATDGVWDVLSHEEVASLMMLSEDAHAAAEVVAQTAKQRWDGSSERRRDDITALVVAFTLLPGGVAEARADALQRSLAGEDVDGPGAGLATSGAAESFADAVASSGGGGGGGPALMMQLDEEGVGSDAAGGGVAGNPYLPGASAAAADGASSLVDGLRGAYGPEVTAAVAASDTISTSASGTAVPATYGAATARGGGAAAGGIGALPLPFVVTAAPPASAGADVATQ